MNGLLARFKAQLAAPVSATGLGLFRIAYALVLFAEVAELYRFRALIFDPIPGVQPSLVHHAPLLVAWMIVLAALALGWATRIAAVVNYVLCVATFGSFTLHQYHADYMHLGIGLLIIFIPISDRLSVDAWLSRRSGTPRSSTTARFYYDALILTGIALPYFDSVFYKLASPMWLSGLGLWLPASLPQITWHDVSFLLDRQWLVKSLGYTALAFESLFILLMWVRSLRPVLAAIGIPFHVGIAYIFPIPWFGLLVVALYALMAPPGWWDALGGVVARLTGRMLGRPATANADPVALPNSGAQFSLPLAATFAIVLFALVSQLQFTYNAPYARELRNFYGLNVAEKEAELPEQTEFEWFERVALGIVPHGVFQDVHFNAYDHLIAVLYVAPDGKEHWLPLTQPSGIAGDWSRGRQWVRWTWRACGPELRSWVLENGIRDFTAFYAAEHGIDLYNTAFRIIVKRIRVPDRWEPGLYRRQCKQPWQYAGYALWLQGRFQFEVCDIEAMPVPHAPTRTPPSPAVAAMR